VAVVCKTYLECQISKENFTDMQRATGQLVDELPEEELTPRLVDFYWAKGTSIMVCHDEMKDWLAARVPTLMAWEGSRLKIVGLDALPTYKRVVVWFPGPAEDAERYLLRLRRLNQGLDTRHWRVYERREESNGVRLVLGIDAASVTMLERFGWRPSVVWGRPHSPFWVLSQRGRNKKKRKRGGGGSLTGYGEYHLFHSGQPAT